MCKNGNEMVEGVTLYCQVGLVHIVKVMSWKCCVEIIPAISGWVGR